MYKAYKVRSVTIQEECLDQPSHSTEPSGCRLRTQHLAGGACSIAQACMNVASLLAILLFIYLILCTLTPDKCGPMVR